MKNSKNRDIVWIALISYVAGLMLFSCIPAFDRIGTYLVGLAVMFLTVGVYHCINVIFRAMLSLHHRSP